jgi:hypothetical protein
MKSLRVMSMLLILGLGVAVLDMVATEDASARNYGDVSFLSGSDHEYNRLLIAKELRLGVIRVKHGVQRAPALGSNRE